MIDVLLCYRTGKKEKITLPCPLPNPLIILLNNKQRTLHHYACLLNKEEILKVIYLEEDE